MSAHTADPLRIFLHHFETFSQLSILIPVWLGLRYWSRLSVPLRWIVGCCLFWALAFLMSHIGVWLWRYNVIVIHLVACLQTVLIGMAYYRLLTSQQIRSALRWGLLPYLVFCVLDSLYWSGLWDFDKYTLVLGTVIVIGLGLLYFEQLLRELRNIRLEQDPMFLVTIGLITYFTSTLMVFLLAQAQQPAGMMVLYSINSLMQLLLHLALGWIFRLAGTTTPERAF